MRKITHQILKQPRTLQIHILAQHTRVLIVHDTDLKRQDAMNYNLILVGGNDQTVGLQQLCRKDKYKESYFLISKF